MTFKEKIKSLCKEKGISTRQLERELGWSNGYVNTLRDKMPTDKAAQVSDFFGLPLECFFPENKNEPPKSPLLEKIIAKASTLNEDEQKELLSFADYIQSKR
jgi:transcriptional regulator with XRE-family HTH domain